MSDPQIIGFDTETHRIGPGAVAPKMVCLTVAANNEAFLVSNGDDHLIESLCGLFAPGPILVGQKTSFDLTVIAHTYPELEPLIWRKLLAGEITDIMIREQLLNLSTHGNLTMRDLPDGTSEPLLYNQAVLEAKYLGIDRSHLKEKGRADGPKTGDSWRLNYDTLDGVPSSEYPEAAYSYATDDALGALLIYEAQNRVVESECGRASLSSEFFNTAADFMLRLITCRGMPVDKEEFARIQGQMEELLSDENMRPLVEAGILRPGTPVMPYVKQLKRARTLVMELPVDHPPDMNPEDPFFDWASWKGLLEEEGIKFKKAKKSSVDTKKLHAHITGLCKKYGLPIKRTDSGNVSADKEVVADLATYDDVMETYRKRQSVQKVVNTELPSMTWNGEIADVVHFPFKVLVETGRTSSSGDDLFPSRNGQQVHPMTRGCHVPRDGHLLVSVDYSTLELATVGQRNLELFGRSVHADKINAGYDLHSYLGARLAFSLSPDFRAVCLEHLGATPTGDDLYEAFIGLKGTEMHDFWEWWRKFAKPVGLGYPGGLGPLTFMGIAKRDYGVNVMEEASKLPDDLFKPSKYLYRLVKRQFGISEDDFEWDRRTKAVALAILLRDIWLDTFDMRPTFDYVRDQMKDRHNGVLGYTDDEDERPIQGYCYTSDYGMHRAGCRYTEAANGFFMQTPAAEGAKTAGIMLVHACRDASAGSILYQVAHPVDFIHDEYLVEIKDDGPQDVHDRVLEVQRIMEKAMTYVLPDVRVGTEAALMRRWDKRAKPVFDENGLLTVWEPKKDD